MSLTAEEIETCPDCGHGHMGRCGGLSFAERIGTVRLSAEATPSRSRAVWYDRAALDDVAGSDRVDRYYDETQGYGALTPEQIETIDPKVLDKVYLGGDRIREDTANG